MTKSQAIRCSMFDFQKRRIPEIEFLGLQKSDGIPNVSKENLI
jgi:hypothetical protein